MKYFEVCGTYNPFSTWKIDVDLSKVDDWGIRWNTLYVRHNPGEEYVEYDAMYTAEQDTYGFKHPVETVINEISKEDYEY